MTTETKGLTDQKGGIHAAWEAAVLPLNYSRTDYSKMAVCYSYIDCYGKTRTDFEMVPVRIVPRLHGRFCGDFATKIATKSYQTTNQGGSRDNRALG